MTDIDPIIGTSGIKDHTKNDADHPTDPELIDTGDTTTTTDETIEKETDIIDAEGNYYIYKR